MAASLVKGNPLTGKLKKLTVIVYNYFLKNPVFCSRIFLEG
jgi:hypothetical protein